MNNPKQQIQAQRAIEDQAIKLGDERGDLEDRLAANTTSIVNLLREQEGSGIPFDRLASLVGVSRQTLYRWQEVARRLTA
jgi:DNA invertase Pin-like site-specific DNA recombinase